MKAVFWFAGDLEREKRLARVLGHGIRKCGDEFEPRVKDRPPEERDADGVDCAMFVGVKNRKLFGFYRDRGMPVIYMDKPYFKKPPGMPAPKQWKGAQYWMWRFSVNSHQPVQFLERERMDEDRWERLKVERVEDWQETSTAGHVIWAGSSEKYHEFHGLEPPTEYAEKVVQVMRQFTDRPIMYRPKPSWHAAVPIKHCRFENKGALAPLLKGAHVLVTHGSSACVDAVLAGVPTIVLGDAVMKGISSVELKDVEKPKKVPYGEVLQVMENLAYCQWSLDEINDGTMWKFMRPRVVEAM